MNKTSISSVVCLEIIDFSKKSKAEQQEAKQQLNARIDHAVLDIPEKDRVIVGTEQGAIITCSGPLESALEDVLFIALTIRDEVLNKNIDSESPLYLLMAINLGSVHIEENATPAIQGEGLLEAQQIMSFANPNQILVSLAYYDMASKLTLEVAQMFEKYDMHAYEHDIYAVRRLNEKSVVENAAAALDHIERPQDEQPVAANTFNWHLYFLPALLALIMFFVLFKWLQHDQEDATRNPIDIESPEIEHADSFDFDVIPDPLPEIAPESEIETTEKQEPTESVKPVKKKAIKKAKQKPVPKAETEETQPVVVDQDVEEPAIETVTEASGDDDKSTWDTIKDSVKTGSEQTCSQAQQALNQCE